MSRRKSDIIVRYFLLTASLTLALPAQTVYALSPALEEDWVTYGILFYDPGDSETAGGMYCGKYGIDGSSSLVGQTTVQQIASFFIGQGFTPEQAAGIIGNAMQESSLWPLALSSSGAHFGIFQWGGSRFEGLAQRMTEAGYGDYVANAEYRNINSDASKAIPQEIIDDILRIQLEYAIEESPEQYNWIDKIKETNTVEEATEAFLYWFERAETDSETEDNLMRFYDTSLGMYYQEARKRREYALSAAGEASGTCGLVAGGMSSVEEAQAWLDATGYNDTSNSISEDFQLPFWDDSSTPCGAQPEGPRKNCVGWSTYFVRAFTSISAEHFTLAQGTGNGNQFVAKLIGVAPQVAYGTEPQPYAVFSGGKSSNAGHTGVVVGVNTEARTLITIEAGCGSHLAKVYEYTFDDMAARYSDLEYAYLMPYANTGG